MPSLYDLILAITYLTNLCFNGWALLHVSDQALGDVESKPFQLQVLFEFTIGTDLMLLLLLLVMVVVMLMVTYLSDPLLHKLNTNFYFSNAGTSLSLVLSFYAVRSKSTLPFRQLLWHIFDVSSCNHVKAVKLQAIIFYCRQRKINLQR